MGRANCLDSGVVALYVDIYDGQWAGAGENDVLFQEGHNRRTFVVLV